MGRGVEGVSCVMQQLTQLVHSQTRAMSAQSLPPISHYSGEGSQSGEDEWIDQFEERARLVGWSEDLNGSGQIPNV